MPTKHAFNSAKSDPADGTLVGASKWNASHVVQDNVNAVSGNYAVLATDELIKATAGAGGITLTMLDATTCSGQIFKFLRVDTGAGNVAFATTSAQTINGAAASAIILVDQWQYVWLQSDGSNWIIINNN